MQSIDVAIIGGGPGGLSAARSILACRPTLKVKVFERSTLQARGASLFVNLDGQQALQAISPELLDRLKAVHSDTLTYAEYTHQGELVERKSATDLFAAMGNAAPLLVSWSDLQRQLAESLPEGVLEAQACFQGYTEEEGGVQVHFAGDHDPLRAKLLIGCDGNRSLVREACLKDGPPCYMGDVIWRGAADLPDWFEAPEGLVVIAERGSTHMIRARGMHRSKLLWVAAAPWPEERLGELASASYIQDPQQRADCAEQIKQRVLDAFEGWPDMARRILEYTPASSITEHGQFYRDPEQIKVWGKGRVTLLGDAAHLATPVTGPGTNQAFIDALELGRAIGELGPTPGALRKYEQVRIPQVIPVHGTSVGIFRSFMSGHYEKDAERNAMAKYFKELKPLVPLECKEPSEATSAA